LMPAGSNLPAGGQEQLASCANFVQVSRAACRVCPTSVKRKNDDFSQKRSFRGVVGKYSGKRRLIDSFHLSSMFLLAKESAMGNVIGTRAPSRSQWRERGTAQIESEKGIMKKFLTTGVLALTLAAISTQTASAWINSKF